MKALVNVQLYDYITYIPKGFILFDTCVQQVGSMSDFSQLGIDSTDLQIIDGKGRLLLPGLINFHTHVYSALVRGLNFHRAPKSFSELLEGVWWRLDHFLSLEDLRLCAFAYGYESLKKGVVGLVDHHAGRAIKGSLSVLENSLTEMGLHSVICFETSDRFNVHQAIEENMEMTKRYAGPIGLHASMSLSDETLKLIKQRIGDHPVHCHISESLEDHLSYSETPIVRLKRHGLLQPASLLAHCVHISPEDAQLIKAHKAVVVLNPRSNLNNGVGSPPYALLMENNISLVAGTDGLGVDVARSWQEVFLGAKAAFGDGIAQGVVDLRQWLIDSYPYYEQMSGRRLGRFEKGYHFDAILVDYEGFTPITEETIFSHVLFGVFDQMDVEGVWIGGKLCLEKGSALPSPKVDLAAVSALWKRIEDNSGYKC